MWSRPARQAERGPRFAELNARDTQPLRRPLLGLLFLFVSGILTGLWLPVSPLPPLVITAIFVGCAWLPPLRARRLPLIWLAVFSLGWTLIAWQLHPPTDHALHQHMQRSREFLTIHGQIIDDPIRVDDGDPTELWRFTLQAESVDRVGHREMATGTIDIRLRLTSPASPPRYGDRWALTGTVQHFSRHESRRWAWLPPYRMHVFPDSAQRVSSDDGMWLKRISFQGRRAAARTLGLGLDEYPDIAGILRALLLGYRHELPDEQHRLFSWTGTLHIFAISGLHVGIWASILFVLVRACGVSKRYWMLWIAPLLITYVIATGLRPSAVRACIMTLTFTGAYLFNRRPDAASAWALAALVILLLSPSQITAPGFIFSFVIVAGLIRLYPLLAGPARAVWMMDPYRPDASAHARSRIYRLGIALIGLAATSLAAWLSSAPLTAHYFNLFTPIALLGNMLVIPAAFVIVLGGILSLIVGTVSDIGAEIFNHANRVILQGLIYSIETLTTIPGGYRFVRSPPLPALLLWYGFLFMGVIWRGRAKQIIYGGLTLITIIMLVAIWQDQSTHVHVLPVGDGHAVLIVNGRETILYDTGPAYRSDALIQNLRRHGVNQVDTLILSHATANHAGGALALLAEMPVGEVWHSAFPSRSPAYSEALQWAQQNEISTREVSAGDRGEWSQGLAWEVLHPKQASAWGRAADASIVLRISRGMEAVLLTGGGGVTTESAILDRQIDPTTTIWIAGSGGPEESASQRWLDAASPEVVIVDVSPFNRQGLPARSTMERLAHHSSIHVLRTDEDGRVSIRLDSRIRRGRQVDRWQVQAAQTE